MYLHTSVVGKGCWLTWHWLNISSLRIASMVLWNLRDMNADWMQIVSADVSSSYYTAERYLSSSSSLKARNTVWHQKSVNSKVHIKVTAQIIQIWHLKDMNEGRANFMIHGLWFWMFNICPRSSPLLRWVKCGKSKYNMNNLLLH